MKGALSILGWRDFVDVALVALIVYRILALFRGTRAAQMLLGVAVLVVASLAARTLQLHTLGWLLDTLWSLWVVVLVVLFQPELRRLLAWLGQGGGGLRSALGSSAPEAGRVAEEIASCAASLAEQRIGALVVVERGTALGQYAELGVALDALVSADLLTSLFLPHSPLHDGAVVVRDDRIVAAGCFLPLSRSPLVNRRLGTRHRAALGVTEETDAVVVAVSEETGHVSLALEGHLEPVADAETLARRLRSLLGADEAVRPLAALRGWLRRGRGAPSTSSESTGT